MTETAPGFPRAKDDTPGKRRCPTTGKGLGVCDCKPCIGRRSQRGGKTRQRLARRGLEAVTGKNAARFAGKLGNEETWNLPLRVEVKSGKQVDPIWTRFAAAEAQSNASKAIGDTRPFLMVAMGSRTPDGLVLVRLSELGRLVEAVLDDA